MDVRRQPLVFGDGGEQSAKRRPFVGIEPSRDAPLVEPPEIRDLGDQPFTRCRQVKRMQAPVVGVAATLDEPAVLQLVDVGDDPARQQAQLRAERLLAATRLRRDRPQYPGVWRGQIDVVHQLREHRGGVMADLGEQECRAVAGIVGVRRGRHGSKSYHF